MSLSNYVTNAQLEAVKNRIKQELMAKGTLNKKEFHPKEMTPGSTGVYRDMEGGAHFDQYDCGHEYDDSVIRSISLKKPGRGEAIREAFKNKEQVRNAFIMSEIFERPRNRKRFSDRFH